MSAILTCSHVSMKYDTAHAVRNVSFEVNDGDYLCIVGENGSGKSTLMKVLLGLLKPAGGKVAFHGFKQIQIGYLPQQTPIQQDFPASVFEVVLSGCLSRHPFPFYTRKDRQMAKDNLTRLGADGFMRKSYRDLSGGQQQRVLLARALCATEKLLLLDEPVTGLDPVMANGLCQLLDTLNKQGLTIIMISHDINSAVKYGNKILHMQTKPLFYGATSDYLKSEIGMRMIGGERGA